MTDKHHAPPPPTFPFALVSASIAAECAAARAPAYAADALPTDKDAVSILFGIIANSLSVQPVYFEGLKIGEIVASDDKPHEFILFLIDFVIGFCPQLDVVSTVWFSDRVSVCDAVRVALKTSAPAELAELHAAAVQLKVKMTETRDQ